jgi:hypothetical protein
MYFFLNVFLNKFFVHTDFFVLNIINIEVFFCKKKQV